MRFRRTILFLLSFPVMFCTGCSLTRRAVAPKLPPELVTNANAHTDVTAGDYLKRYHDFINDPTHTAQQKQDLRNEILNTILRKIDTEYFKFTSDLYSGKASYDIFGDLSQLGLTSAATVVGDVDVKDILSAAATADKGAHASVDKKLLQEQSIAALVTQMDALRAKALQPVETGLAQDVSTYPLEMGLRDLMEYHRAGSILSALGAITGKAQDELKTNQTEMLGVRKLRAPGNNPPTPNPPKP